MRWIQSSSPARGALLASTAALLLGAVLGGCDNPACVFGSGNCQGGAGGGVLGTEAFAPIDNQWIQDGAPAISDAFPKGNAVSTTSPIAVFFSESLVESTVLTAFRLERVDAFGALPVVATPALVGDGRVLVLLPGTALAASTSYRVVYNSNANARDFTGQSLGTTAGAVVASFTTGATNPPAPVLLATYPADGASGQSETGEIVALFDRPMVAGGFAGNGWSVSSGGAPVALDPDPTPLAAAGGLGGLDTRVWRWRSVDGAGVPQALGAGVTVLLSLSPAGSKLVASGSGGGELPATLVDFTTAAFSAPTGARIASAPSDAIGINNLTPGNSEALRLEVDLAGALGGDRLLATLFGTDFSTPPKLVAVQREVVLPAGPQSLGVLELADFDLTTSTSPLKARFADGTLRVALRLVRGGVASPVRLLDVDPALAGIQHPVLDTVRPTLLDLVAPGGGGDFYRSDFSGLTLMGTASEPLRRVLVTTPLLDNGPDPDVVAAQDDGFFVARPVDLGALGPADLPLPYEFVLFDRALNASTTGAGLYRQLGAVGGGAPTPGGTIEVELFDAATLAPVANGLVVTHADLGDGSAYPLIGSAVSDALGAAAVGAHDLPAVGTILTVDAAGYGRVTLHGFSAQRFSVPLEPLPPPAAAVAGTVSSTGLLASLTLPGSKLALDDSRRIPGGAPTAPVSTCVGSPFGGQGVTCPFGPVPVRARRPGARTLFAGDFDLAEPNFSAAGLIKAFAFDGARGPLEPAAVGVDNVEVGQLLNEAGVPQSLLPVAGPLVVLSSALSSGVDTSDLVNDAQFGAAPRVGVELLLPGQLRAVAAGLGIAYPAGVGQWTGRTAYPGAVASLADELGDPEGRLRLFGEVRDNQGALARVSLALDQLPAFANTLFLPPVPVPAAPLDGATLSAAAFDVELPNALPDGVFPGTPNGAGLYRVELVDQAGRPWVLLRPDQPDGAGALVRVHVPDLTGAGGAPLAPGTAVVRAGLLAHEGFNPSQFFFSDLEREQNFRSSSAPIAVIVP